MPGIFAPAPADPAPLSREPDTRFCGVLGGFLAGGVVFVSLAPSRPVQLSFLGCEGLVVSI